MKIDEDVYIRAVAKYMVLQVSKKSGGSTPEIEKELEIAQGAITTMDEVMEYSEQPRPKNVKSRALEMVVAKTGYSLGDIMKLFKTPHKEKVEHEDGNVVSFTPRAVVTAPPVMTERELIDSAPEEGDPEYVSEWSRICADFEEFCKYLEIPYRPGISEHAKEGGNGPFIINEHQRRIAAILINEWLDGKPVRNIILKARQLGITTVLLAFWVWLMIQREHFVVFFLIDKDEHMRNKRTIIIDWLNHLSEIFEECPKISERGGKRIVLSNKAKFLFESSKSPNPGTSEKIDAIHLSEMPKWMRGRAQQVMKSLVPSLPESKNTFVVNESTAEGMGYFHRLWNRAMTGQTEGRTKTNPIFLSWKLSEEYREEPPRSSFDGDGNFIYKNEEIEFAELDDIGNIRYNEEEVAIAYRLSIQQIYWRRLKIANAFAGSRDDFDQEYPTTPDHAWEAAGRLFFGNQLVKQARDYEEDPIYVGDIVCANGRNDPLRLYTWDNYKPAISSLRRGPLAVFEKPIAGVSYKIGGDVAQGLTVVSESGSEDPDYSVMYVIKDETGEIAARYRSRMKAEEMALKAVLLGAMYNMAQINIERNDVGLACWTMFKQTGYGNVYVREGNAPWEERAWNKMTKANRKPMLIEMRQHLRKYPQLIKDRVLLKEIAAFVVDSSGRPGAMEGEHDDCIMAYCHAFHMIYETHGVKVPIIEEPEPEPDPFEFASLMEDNGLSEGMW